MREPPNTDLDNLNSLISMSRVPFCHNPSAHEVRGSQMSELRSATLVHSSLRAFSKREKYRGVSILTIEIIHKITVQKRPQLLASQCVQPQPRQEHGHAQLAILSRISDKLRRPNLNSSIQQKSLREISPSEK